MNEFEILNLIDIIRLIPILVILAYAGYMDHKTGEVTNKAWLYTPIGLTIVLTEYAILSPNLIIPALEYAAIITVVSLALFKFRNGKDWGGADAKALIMLALTYPIAPAYLAWLPLFPLLIFTVASAIAIIPMIIKKQVRFLPYVFIGTLILAII